MTQLFSGSTSTRTQSSEKVPSEKRALSGLSIPTNKASHGPNNQVSMKLKNFFRINSSSNNVPKTKDKDKDRDASSKEGDRPAKSDLKTSLRQSRFIPHIGSRNRTNTVASEGNTLNDSLSPTVQSNPYFQHQGPPTLRHHNDNSVPPSPPEAAGHTGKIDAVSGAHDQQALAGREELNRKLRRVASAPNAQGFFPGDNKDRPESGVAEASSHETLGRHPNTSTLSVVGTASEGGLLGVPSTGIPSPGQIRNSLAFRRTYSSNSIKMRTVEVGPGSFEKVKLIGKGDVGKVYLVKEYKSQRLYAMKGKLEFTLSSLGFERLTTRSPQQERNDKAEQDQACLGRAGNSCNEQSPIHCDTISLVSIL